MRLEGSPGATTRPWSLGAMCKGFPDAHLMPPQLCFLHAWDSVSCWKVMLGLTPKSQAQKLG